MRTCNEAEEDHVDPEVGICDLDANGDTNEGAAAEGHQEAHHLPEPHLGLLPQQRKAMSASAYRRCCKQVMCRVLAMTAQATQA